MNSESGTVSAIFSQPTKSYIKVIMVFKPASIISPA